MGFCPGYSIARRLDDSSVNHSFSYSFLLFKGASCFSLSRNDWDSMKEHSIDFIEGSNYKEVRVRLVGNKYLVEATPSSGGLVELAYMDIESFNSN